MKTHLWLLIVLSALAFDFRVQAKETQPAADVPFKKITKAPAPEKTPEAHEEVTPDSTASEKPAVSTHPAPDTAETKPAAGAHARPAAGKAHEAKDAAHATSAAPVVDADKSLHWLMHGNERYVGKHFRADGRGPADRQRLVAGQHPHAIVLSCADSRVPPEIVFDQELGEIFTIRVAGEALDSSVIASIEYAVEHLGSRLLVVMGHTKCGAVDTALKVKEGASAGSPDLDKLLGDIRPRLKSIPADKISPNLEVESTVNADGVARDLLKRSEIVRKKVEAGELVIKPALYHLDTGKVNFY